LAEEKIIKNKKNYLFSVGIIMLQIIKGAKRDLGKRYKKIKCNIKFKLKIIIKKESSPP
jgi:hypothetical protein